MAFMLGNHLTFIDSFQFMSSSLDKLVSNLGMDHYFLSGGGGGVLLFLGLADNFFQRVMHFKQFFSLHLVMKTIFYNHF